MNPRNEPTDPTNPNEADDTVANNSAPPFDTLPPINSPFSAKERQGIPWIMLPRLALTLLILNFLTSFKNVWSTPFIQPDKKISPEIVGLWVILLLLVALFGKVSRRAIYLLTGVFFVLVIGRYADVTVPAWFGRKINLYWDAQHLPKFLEVASQDYSWWQLVAMVGGAILGLWLLIRMIRLCIEVLAWEAAPHAVRSPLLLLGTFAMVGFIVSGLMKVEPFKWYVSEPIAPVYQRQAHLLAAAWFPERFLSELPDTPSLDSDLKLLQGAEVKVLFLESYGATTYEREDLFEALHPARLRLEQAANDNGRQVLSAFVRAAAFGGASDLSHLSFLSGIDLTDPVRHDLLITTDRPTITDTFEKAGYRSIGLYPAMSWDWPEVSFYSFDHYLDASSLDYQGPKFGLWWLPDQFSMAKIDELYPPSLDSKPRFLFYPTITTHIPFRPTPPYQPDWSRVTSAKPYSDAETQRAMNDHIDWHDLFRGYINSFNYTFEWLAGYQALEKPRESVIILVGDHQPAGGITGSDATWNVPVHIITPNESIAASLRQSGFIDGMTPPQRSLGHVSELTLMLLSAFDSGETDIAGIPPNENSSEIAE